MIGLGLRVNVSGAMAKCSRLKTCVENVDLIVLRYEGQHSVLHVANETIARHALAHGDNVWCIQPDTLKEMAAVVRRGFVKVFKDPAKTDVKPEMIMASNLAVGGLAQAVLEGKTDGPARTPAWNAYKAANFGPPTPNMVASREWLRSLRGSLRPRGQRAGGIGAVIAEMIRSTR